MKVQQSDKPIVTNITNIIYNFNLSSGANDDPEVAKPGAPVPVK